MRNIRGVGNIKTAHKIKEKAQKLHKDEDVLINEWLKEKAVFLSSVNS